MTIKNSPEQLDVMAMAKSNGSLAIHLTREADAVALSRQFSRLQADACEPEGLSLVSYQAEAECRPGPSGNVQPWLHLEASATLRLICQRCLSPADIPVAAEQWFRFVADEATAEAEDDDCEEDVLALESRFNLTHLVEDELLMAIPLVPMHDVCPVEVPTSAGEDEFQAVMETRPSAFAALSQLKKPG